MPVEQFECRPSEVRGKGRSLPVPACTVPLAGVIGRMESEVAVAAITQVCQQDGDDWRDVTSVEFGAMLQAYENSNAILATMHGGILNALNELHHKGLVLIDRDKNPHIISITPQLVELIQ